MTSEPEFAPWDQVVGSRIQMHGEARDASTFTQIGAQVIVPSPVPEVRYSLPPDAAEFTGRVNELGRITAVGAVLAVRAIEGMPGAGKTALAVHAAHMLRNRFPDRQLFIDLHAHTPGREPVRPEDALAGLLAAVGVDPRFLPGDLDGRVVMWRDRMARQRALLVLDNAGSTRQVAPLLPGGEGCLVLVTSRRHLGDLPGAVTPVLLDVLPPQRAREMFTRLAPGASGSAGEIAEVVELAGFLPLAISLLARVFARHRAWTLGDLATEIREGLLTLTAENNSIAAAFEVSYRHLDAGWQRFFCLLGLHPGTTINAHAAAALAGTSPKEAARLLDGLHGEGLLTEVGHRRYGMHDLVRRYARDRATDGTTGDSQQALERLLDYYQYTAARAGTRLARQTYPSALPATPVAPELITVREPYDPGQALVWVRAERVSLLACLDYATSTGQHARVIAFTAALAGLMHHDGPWADAITRHMTAIQAAEYLGDLRGQAGALNELGHVRWLTGDYPGAIQAQEQALSLYRDLGDQLGQANALNDLGTVLRLACDYDGAALALDQALSLYHDLGDRLGQANTLHYLGALRRLTSNFPGATQVQEQALEIYRDLGDQLGQAAALRELGALRWLADDFSGATHVLEEALNIYRSLGDPLGQASALTYLGNVRRLTGDFPSATHVLEEALDICRSLGNRLGQAHALHYLGNVRRLTGDFPSATQAQEQALDIYRDLGDQRGQASALCELGAAHRLTGDFPGAAQALDLALDIYQVIDNRNGEAEALNERGTLHRICGELKQAKRCHQHARELACAIANTWDEAHALAGLGRCAMDTNHARQAEVLLRQAHNKFQRISAAEAPGLLAELNALIQSQHAS